MPNTGVMQPGTLQQPSYPVSQQPVQPGMPASNYQMATASPMTNSINYQPAQSGMSASNYQMATASPMTNSMNYQTVQPVMPVVPAVPMQVGPIPCGTPVPPCPVPVPQAVQQVQTIQQTTEPQVASTQATTAHHKKTTYVEAYLEPIDANVPLMQPTVKKQSTSKKADSVQGDIVYVDQQPVKNSTMQDYNLYLMEKEYYSDDQPSYNQNVQVTSQGSRTKMNQQLTCENLPLATTFIRVQSYTNLNNSTETLKEGTLFHDLYDVYTPKKVAQPYIYMHTDKGGRH